MSDVIHIACSADRRLLPDCGVMLHSLFQANAGASFNVHFLFDDRLPRSELRSLRCFVQQQGAVFSPQRVARELAAQFPHSRRFGYNAWYRVLLPDVLPALRRVLYLDSDLLVTGSLRPLWEIDLAGCALAAVTQPIPDDMIARIEGLGLPAREHYFNTGVMVLDLEQLRRRECRRHVMEFIRSGRAPMPWADQDPLNAILHASRLTLHPRWNVMTPMLEAPDRLPPFSAGELREAAGAPAVIHFIGEYKPLHFRCRHPYRPQFFEHLRHTPWRRRRIYGRPPRYFVLDFLPKGWREPADRAWTRLRERLRALAR